MTTPTTTTADTSMPNAPAARHIAKPKQTRRCIFGCVDRSIPLRRFPIHDRQRCDYWIKFFQVKEEHIKEHGLVNLRVCMKHFLKRIEMANNKIKLSTVKPKSEAIKTTVTCGENASSTNNLIKRTASMSSASSSASVQSDSRSTTYSDTETVNTRQTTGHQKRSAPKDFICGNSGGVIANRKIFMITEKRVNGNHSDGGYTNGDDQQSEQKRKMYLVIENAQQGNSEHEISNTATTGEPATKKLTLLTDKSQSHLAEKIERILPEIINRIQANEQKAFDQKCSLIANSMNRTHNDSDHRRPITLPPKKNRRNIVAQPQALDQLQRHSSPIVANTNGHSKHIAGKNINLSADFLFLMKMLPMLETIPEPQKNHVKANIEKLISQSLE